MALSQNINTANTLSINFIPGQDIRFPTTASDSIFTFGSFRLEQDVSSDMLSGKQQGGRFTSFSTLSSLGSEQFDINEIVNTNVNELNIKKNDPASYAYFGSFYTQVAIAINNIIDTFPYAAMADVGSVFDYSESSALNKSSFKIALSALTNQGSIILFSGSTSDRNEITLFDDTNKFGIQLSGSVENIVYPIESYSFATGITGFLEFTITGILLSTGITNDVNLYIRPSAGRLGQYKRTISNLETQLLFGGDFLVPNHDDETFENKNFIWPRINDGFNPDIIGNSFINFRDEILEASRSVDEAKTNIMLRTMIPENYLDLDSGNEIYRKILTVFATEFDTIKQYIDGIAFSHTISYDGEENLPDKFISRLSNLLGLELVGSFNDVNFFEFLTTDIQDTGKSATDFNLDLWRRILVNINWLYKKKGTRDALMFIFKLMGAPDCLVNFNEFVYKINRVVTKETNQVGFRFSQSNTGNTIDVVGPTRNTTFTSFVASNQRTRAFSEVNIPPAEGKINENGFINYDFSEFVFQEGGHNRGNGQAYINQWRPEFDPTKQIDNKKIYTGNSEFNGTENIINTKEIYADINAASAIECDVKAWYELGIGWWLWGSTHLFFSGLTVPFEWQIEDISTVAPNATGFGSGITNSTITGMTIAEWIDFIYASNIQPQNRKTAGYGQVGHTWIYMNLKKIYMTYMLWTNNEESNRLTYKKIEPFIELIERGFSNYVPQLLPATTILDCYGTKYKNSVFCRQKFVYPPGIDDGSTFQIKLPINLEPRIAAVNVTGSVNNNFPLLINSVQVTGTIVNSFNPRIQSVNVRASADNGTQLKVNAVNVKTDYHVRSTITKIPDKKKLIGNAIIFPAE